MKLQSQVQSLCGPVCFITLIKVVLFPYWAPQLGTLVLGTVSHWALHQASVVVN